MVVRRIRATYQDKSFRPDSECDIPDGTVVELEVLGPVASPPSEMNSEKRAAIRESLVQRLLDSNLSDDSPKLTRDELHDRR